MKNRKHTLKEWIIAVRPWSFPASAMPVIVSLGYIMWKSSGAGFETNWYFGIWALVNIMLFHSAGNTWSDYFDFKKSVDAEDTFGVRTLTSGMFTPKEIMGLSICLLVISLAGGITLMAFTGLPLLWIGLAGLACALLYPSLKYRALGDLVIFVAFALLPTLGTAFVTTGNLMWDILWLTPPVGLITVAILHANNARDISTDSRAHIRTFAMDIGQPASRAIYYAELIVPFVWITACSLCGIFPLWSLIALIAVIPAIGNIRMMSRSKSGDMTTIGTLDEMTAKLQIIFSMLLTISFVIASFI